MPARSTHRATIAMLIFAAPLALHAHFNQAATVQLQAFLHSREYTEDAILPSIQATLKYRPDVNPPRGKGVHWMTPLASAVAQGWPKVAKLLLEAGADPNNAESGMVEKGGPAGLTALMFAVYPHFNGFHTGFQLAPDAGKVRERKEGVEMIRLLVKHGARLDDQNRKGQTPLMLAVLSGQPHLVHELISLKADPWVEDQNGLTAAQMKPTGKGYQEMVKDQGPIIERQVLDPVRRFQLQRTTETRKQLGATMQVPPPVARIIGDYLFRQESSPTGAGQPPALERKDAQPVERKGAQFEERKGAGEAKITSAARAQALAAAVQGGDQNTVATLLDDGASVDLRLEGGLTPLMLAALSKQPGVVQLLLDRGADMALQDDGTFTAHDHAFGCPAILPLLEERQTAQVGDDVD